MDKIIGQGFGIHFQGSTTKILLQPTSSFGWALDFKKNQSCFDTKDANLPFRLIYQLPKNRNYSDFNWFRYFLTSVSERIAKILAIMVENPGFRQLSAIKPNFNSINTRNDRSDEASCPLTYQQYTRLHLYYYSMLGCSLDASGRDSGW